MALNAEEARARLEAVRDAGWRGAASRRVRRLRWRHRGAVAALLAPEPDYSDPNARRRHAAELDAAAAVLDTMPAGDRLAAMEALHPKLGPVLARWWVDAAGQPYTAGWSRKAFRAPGQAELTRPVRLQSLRRTLEAVGAYDRDALWLAAWAPHLGHGRHSGASSAFADLDAGPLLAAAVDSGGPAGDEVFETLLAVGRGDHPVGIMGRHVIVALLRSARPDGWEFVERLLLAAQRQEGLRQSILEAADEAHPGAFDRLLDVVLDRNLLRFAAAVRAAGVWVGFDADVEHLPDVERRIGQLRRYRADPVARQEAIAAGDPWETYIALAAVAMGDAVEAITAAGQVLATRPAPARAAAVRLLGAARLTPAQEPALRALDDADLAVAWLAFGVVAGLASAEGAPPDLFDRLSRLAQRLPDKERSLAPIGIEERPLTVSRAPVVAAMFWHRGRRPLADLLPWVPAMDAATRRSLAAAAGQERRLGPGLREMLVVMVGDRSPQVRAAAVQAMERLRLDPAEAPAVEALLTRKAGDLRRGVIALLAGLPPAEAVRSAERLWAGDTAQRDAACELLRTTGRHPASAEAAGRFAAAGLSSHQVVLLGELVAPPAAPPPSAAGPAPLPPLTAATAAGPEGTPLPPPPPSPWRPGSAPLPPPPPPASPTAPAPAGGIGPGTAPGLGLYDPARRAPVPAPAAPGRPGPFVADTACRLAGALDDLAETHRDTPLELVTWQGAREVLLADARWLPSPFRPGPPGDAADGTGLILADVFRPWWADRPADCRHDDALDALRALAALEVSRGAEFRGYAAARRPDTWWDDVIGRLAGPARLGELRHAGVVHHVLAWMVAGSATAATVAECLDAVAATAAAVPAAAVRALPAADTPPTWRDHDWRDRLDGHHPWLTVLRGLFRIRPDLFSDDHIRRWFLLARWFDEPRPGVRRRPTDENLLLRAHAGGVATDDDVLDRLLQPHSRLLPALTRHRRRPAEERHPAVVALADRVRRRVVEVELGRGELATPASATALGLASISGAATVAGLLARLGRASLVRGWIGGNEGREAVYSHLLRVSHPAPGDSAGTLRAAARAAGVADGRLLELALYAPQWAALVEEAIAWPGLAEGVWWFHAHAKDDQWSVPEEVRETWAALSAERTPLSGQDLIAGAVDVDWFHRARAALGADRWKKLHAAAKLASGGSGHRRAQLFAEAMSATTGEDALAERIRAKRHQDSVRALGLVPLPADPAERDAALLRRYGLLREFERGSARFGSQRRSSEQAAVRIGVENLARTAGAVDPQRFVWAMEAAEAGDLADGPVSVTADGVTVTLAVDAEGLPGLEVRRAGKLLKALPAGVRKTPAVAELAARKTALGRQASRVRRSLESAMVNQDPFGADDFAALERHPVVAPMLGLVVFADEAGALTRRAAGRFVDVDGRPSAPAGRQRLAHPLDLLAAGQWIAWQEQLFADEHRQPFKQAFRELYLLTEAERSAGPASRRYEGHQLQPRQALALLTARGWLADRESGDVSRVFHAHDTVARLQFRDGFLTPAEVELPAIDAVSFTRRGDWVAQPLDAVAPIVFSETMRDLDLVVSVAHAGGVDPETSASTVEMRAALVRETARVLKLDNVRMVNSHVVVAGRLGEYSVHLGSGVVHRRPGGAVCIIPVDSQRRGRLFLPFADDDPKTAEVVSKVLLLANDREIKDPTILSQLRL